MLRHTNVNTNPAITAAVEGLCDEDRQFELAERRLSMRHPLSRPVRIEVRENDHVFSGFSKNISAEGIGILSQTKFADGTEARIVILSSRSNHPAFVCKLAWCKPFGEGWHVSGWKFRMLVRGTERGLFQTD